MKITISITAALVYILMTAAPVTFPRIATLVFAESLAVLYYERRRIANSILQTPLPLYSQTYPLSVMSKKSLTRKHSYSNETQLLSALRCPTSATLVHSTGVAVICRCRSARCFVSFDLAPDNSDIGVQPFGYPD